MLETVIARFLAALVAVIAPLLQLWDALKKRLIRAQKDEAAVGNLGLPYVLVLKLPSALSVAALLLIVFSALTAIIGGIQMTNAADAKAQEALRSSGWQVPILLFEGALWISLAYLILAVVVYFDLPLRSALALARGWKHHPGWISAHRLLSESGPFNIEENACQAAANAIFRALASGEIKYDQHRASRPEGLSRAEMANCLLVAATIESQVHDLKKTLNFGHLYSSVAEFAKTEGRPLSPSSLASQSADQLYSSLRSRNVASDPVFPDEQSIVHALRDTLSNLQRQYGASGLGLADSWLVPPKHSLARLHRRLSAFSAFAGDRHDGMRVLVLKLAVRWEIWPNLRPGPFIYAFNRKIARLLLNLGCIVVRVEDKSIDIDDDFRRLVASVAMHIVERVAAFINSQDDTRTIQLCEARFGRAPGSVEVWQVADEVDYFLFSQSQATDGGYFGEDAGKPWQIENNSFVRKDK